MAAFALAAGCLRQHEIRPRVEAREVGRAFVYESEAARHEHPGRHFCTFRWELFGPFPRVWLEPRLRMEVDDNRDLDASVSDTGFRTLTRFRAMLDSGFYHDSVNYRFDFQDSQEIFSSLPETAQDELDIRQAFVLIATSRSIASFKLGRQELDFASGRILGSDWHDNLDRSFDGARLILTDGFRQFDLEPRQWTWRTEVFVADPVRHEPADLNVEHEGPRVFGVTHGDRRCFPLRLDLAAIHTRSGGAEVPGELGGFGREELLTVSLRLSGEELGFTEGAGFEVEGAFQLGNRGPDEHLAGMLSACGSYTFPTPWGVRLRAGLEAASGDGDPADGVSGTFRPPFPGDLRGKTGLLGLSGLANSVVWTAGASFGPAEYLRLGVDARWHRVSDVASPWLDAWGRVLSASPGAHALGRELDFYAKYRFTTEKDNDVSFEAGYAVFEPSGGISSATGRVQALYLQTSMLF